MNLTLRRALVFSAIFVSLSHLYRAPLLVSAVATTILVWAVVSSLLDWRYPNRWVHGALTLGSGVVIWAGYRTVLGLEPAMGLLVMILSLKLFEQRTRKDQMVTIWLIAILILGDLIISQNLFTTLIGIVGAFVIVNLLLLMNLPTKGVEWGTLRRRSFQISKQVVFVTTPIAVIFFLVFPRFHLNLFGDFAQGSKAQIGFNDELRPGEVAELAQSKDVAFRVTFRSTLKPKFSEMYWRGAVLSATDGFNWIRAPRRTEALPPRPAAEELIEQEIVLEAHANRWLFALERPMSVVMGGQEVPARYLYGDIFENETRVSRRVSYRARSDLTPAPRELRSDERERETRLRATMDPRVLALAKQLGREGNDADALTKAIIEHFQTEKFQYTLSPGKVANIADFLFGQKRQGFCEHFASAAAVLLRLNKIPARVIVGFHGGEFNPYGEYFTVRYQDAHAWVEVWSAERGWWRFDPVAAVAPARIGLGGQGFANQVSGSILTRPEVERLQDGPKDLKWFLTETVFFVDSVNSRWNLFLVNYDLDFQKTLLDRLNLNLPYWQLFLVAIGFSTILILAILGYVLIRQRRQEDQVLRAYDRLSRRLAKRNLARFPNEGPLQYRRRASESYPEASARIQAAIDSYIDLRYGGAPVDSRALGDLERKVRDV